MPDRPLAEQLLALWLRATGVFCASALIAVVMPLSWHAATHAWLGLGELPEGPIVEYLARGMSAMCGLFGLLLIWLARDVRRHRGVIAFQAAGLMGVSLAATLVQLKTPMPRWWIMGDVASVWLFGIVAFALLARVPKSLEKD